MKKAIIREGKAVIGIRYKLIWRKRKKDKRGRLTMEYDKKDFRTVKRCARKFGRTMAYLQKHGFTIYESIVEAEREN